MNKGWECPKCGAVWAIWVKGCENCKGAVEQAKSNAWDEPYAPVRWVSQMSTTDGELMLNQ
jgi:hypothetical protein